MHWKRGWFVSGHSPSAVVGSVRPVITSASACVRAYIHVFEWVNVWVCVYVYMWRVRALVYVWRIYTGDCVCVCVCTCWASITSPWTSHTNTHIHIHTYIHTKQPAYGRHRKTYFPLKTYNAGVRQCVVCCVLRWGRKIKKENTTKNRGETHEKKTKIIILQVYAYDVSKTNISLIINTTDWNANCLSFW